MNRAIRPKKGVFIAYLLPCLCIYIFVFIIPAAASVLLSFFKFSNIRKFSFTGLQNYITLINDPNVWIALKNNLFLVAVSLVGQIGIAFLLACILSSSKTFLAGLCRTVIYFPVTISAVVIGYVWKMVFDYNYGIVVKFLEFLGRSDLIAPWLGQESTVMLCVCIPLVWQYVGFHLVILVSAMTSIDQDIYESSSIDGAGAVQKAVYITLPMIKNTLLICVFLCISANMKVFDHIMTLTNGGPGFASNVLALYAYNVSFSQMNMGYGSAISVFILAITIILFLISNGVMSVGGKKE
ncbi:ABC transporter permease subunit [Clostridium sp. MCC353]|uniref:carbohydrate ABC transporter permease n=1 Tax=Clostridium sp. MCC353 TaxID=2592646 RepID=UPI001C026FA9|nr:sugar ABC transporter permease [Clostridium sp. MCC353]MBT9776924.1 ABC transporter permease subunit [Clostridium sp. MCC353]